LSGGDDCDRPLAAGIPTPLLSGSGLGAERGAGVATAVGALLLGLGGAATEAGVVLGGRGLCHVISIGERT
jgi:hypothetical protein